MAISLSLGATSFISLSPMYRLAGGNVFKSRYHAQGRGLSATGGAYQHDKFLVCNVKVELLHRYDALVGNLKIVLLFRLVLGLFLGALFG